MLNTRRALWLPFGLGLYCAVVPIFTVPAESLPLLLARRKRLSVITRSSQNRPLVSTRFSNEAEEAAKKMDPLLAGCLFGVGSTACLL